MGIVSSFVRKLHFGKLTSVWRSLKIQLPLVRTVLILSNGIVGTVASLSDATELCDSQSGFYENDNAPMLFSIPATAYENMQLIEAVSQTSYEFVLLNTDVLYL